MRWLRTKRPWRDWMRPDRKSVRNEPPSTRALCLLGLSRTVDAERAVERLIMEHPDYVLPEAEVSPRLFTMFVETRQRVLPAAARQRYTEAKAAFDRRQFGLAARAFREVQTLLADPAFTAEVDGLRDLRVLSEGFLSLADEEVTKAEMARLQPVSAPAAAPPAAPAPAVAAASALTTPSPVADAPAVSAMIYSDAHADVTPPVDISRRLPAWNPPPALARTEFHGVLEVIVDESGAVASADLVESVNPVYDQSLVDAAKRWRFRPATKEGTAVRYRKTFEIVLNRR